MASWVAAGGSLLAFGLALWIYSRSVRDQRRAQARLVCAFTYGRIFETPARQLVPIPVEDAPDSVTSDLEVDIEPLASGAKGYRFDVATRGVRWSVQNHSDEMVADLTVDLIPADATDVIHTLLSVRAFAPDYSEDSIYFGADDRITRDVRVRVSFTDAVGRRWSRTSGDSLRPA